MTPEEFEARARANLRARGEPPSAAHDEAVLALAREASSEIRTRVRKNRRRWWMPISVAAATGVLAIGLWSTIDRSASRPVTTRGVASDELLPANGATLETAPARFDWRARPGAASYRVTLRAADASVVWRSESTPESEIAIPLTLSIAPGATYFWSVEYESPATTGSMGLYTFRITDSTR